MIAICFPNFEHGKISVSLYKLGNADYPSRAECGSLDNINMAWLNDNWPTEPGWFWDKDDCCHATVKKLL